MKIVTPPLIIKDSDAFKNDLFDRKIYGEALVNLVQSSSDELVIALDGRWGEGKTTFIKMWRGLLSESNIPNIYIDAFLNDYLEDAFISVASEITSFVEKNICKDNNEKAEELIEKTKKVGAKLLSWSTKVAVKAATLGAIKDADLEELKDIKSDIAKGTSELFEKIVEERLASYSEDIELINSFKVLLSEIPLKLGGSAENPLVIIIDELDRCKPSFAIEMLEKIKHLFSVKNVVFILVMNKEQLEESVRCIYGQNIDAHTYLQKFINLETQLPKQIANRHTNDLKNYSRRLLQLHELETWGDDEIIIDCIEALANHFNLTLRQLEKVYTNLALFYAVSIENQLRLVHILAFLSVIKTIKPKMFDKLLYQKICYSDVCLETKLSDMKEKGNKLDLLMSWVKFSLITDQEFEELEKLDGEVMTKKFSQLSLNDSIERERIIPIHAQKLSMFMVTY